MCGIVGYISNDNIDLSTHLNRMHHRGPDASGIYYDSIKNTYIGLGHVRLSIIDTTSGANQPFYFNNKYVLVFNGEIYNYIELRTILKSRGYKFDTESDTEVLISAYDYYQEKIFDYIDGIFSFCIYDKVKKKIFLARDHLGIKPIYYFYNKKLDEFFFASELKVLFDFKKVPKKISPDNICEFLFNGWLYEPDTGFENIFKLMPGSYIEYNVLSHEKKTITYFDACRSFEKYKSLRTKNIKDLIYESIKKQCRSDVLLGVFFSGGIDSTIIANSVNNTKCLTAKYNSRSMIDSGIDNDFLYSQKIGEILNLDIKTIYIDDKKIDLEVIKYIVKSVEELNADLTYYVSEKVAKEARLEKYIVMLSGMGADEIFGGYPRYKVVKYRYFYKVISYLLTPFRGFVKRSRYISKKVDRFFNSINEVDFIYSYSSLIGSFSKMEIFKIIKDASGVQKYHNKINALLNKVKDESNFKKAFYLDLYGFLSHNFIIADKSSMRASIEMRVPLASKDLVIKNFYEKENMILDFFNTKKQLKKILFKILPKNVINRRKVGFNPPIDGIINSIGYKNFLSIIESGRLNQYINLEYIEELIYNHYNNIDNNTYKLWQILFLHFWIEENE